MSFEAVLSKVIQHECMTEEQKRNFLVKIIQHLSTKKLSYDVVSGSFDFCYLTALENTSNSATATALYAYSIWGARHLSYLKEYLSIDRISISLTENSPAKLPVALMWLKEGLQILHKDVDYINSISLVLSGVLESKLEEYGRQSITLSQFAEIYLLCPTLLPPQHSRLSFTKTIMHCVASFPMPTKPETLKHMKNVGNLVTYLWENLQLEDILFTLIAMFDIISNTDTGAEVCPAMAHLLSLVFPQVVEGLGPRIVSDAQNSNNVFIATLNRLCVWLVAWPTAHATLVHWIKTLVRLLYQNGRNIVPSKLTYEQVPKLIEALRIPICRPGVCAVITIMLMSFQCSAVAFHKLIPQLITIIESLENESSETARETISSLVKLCHAQMVLFPGHPETYQVLMETLYKYQRPSDDEITTLIQDHQWMNSYKDDNSRLLHSSKGLNKLLADVNASADMSLATYHKRSPGQRVGLRNLGNTCYMNSVIQALFMTDDFRHSMLHTQPKSNQNLLVKLQHLFTSLCFSDRSYISPITFHDQSRPPWFSPGMQQDCSEYLRHLMITLHEEERSGQKLPEYQERMIIESETASLASDVQPALEDSYQQQLDIEDQESDRENKNAEEGYAADGMKHSVEAEIEDSKTSPSVQSPSCYSSDDTRYKTLGDNKWKIIDSENTEKDLSIVDKKMELPFSSHEKTSSESASDNSSISYKRKHNVSPASSQSLSVKSSKGEHSSALVSEVDNSSDSGISGDLAEELDFALSSSPTSVQKESFPNNSKSLSIEEVASDNDYFVSQVHKIFGGKISTSIKCLKCKTESIHRDVFTDLNLTFQDSEQYNASSAIRKQPERLCKQKEGDNAADLKIEDMITNYLTPERLSGENQYECERCGSKQDAERSIQILETPRHLILTQLRFYYDTCRGQRQKVFTNVDFSEELLFPNKNHTLPYNDLLSPDSSKHPDLPTHLSSQSTCSHTAAIGGVFEGINFVNCSICNDSNNTNIISDKSSVLEGYDRYTLYGVVVHSGFSSEGGHYYCYARNSSVAGLNQAARERLNGLGDWHNFNDEKVTKTDFCNISRLTRTFSRDTAYLLFYRKVDPNEEAPSQAPILEDLSLLRTDLQVCLQKDNLLYKSEQENEFLRKRYQQRATTVRTQTFRKDDDDRPPPSGSCGGGSGVSITSREVF